MLDIENMSDEEFRALFMEGIRASGGNNLPSQLAKVFIPCKTEDDVKFALEVVNKLVQWISGFRLKQIRGEADQ